MNENYRCPKCGQPVPQDAPEGLCPRCLGALNLDSETGVTGAEAATATPPPSASELSPLFPQLEILEVIGKGGMGVVYKVRQKELDRIAALKILPPGIGGDPAFAERFAREAKALARLNHPGIVTIYDSGRADGLYYFLMEFVDEVSLGRLMHGGRVSAREALAIVPQICDALQYAHDQGIVHRDIKPENILLDRQGRVKVADFGLAKLVAGTRQPLTPALSPSDGERMSDRADEGKTPALTVAGKVMGTPAYMAPEQAEHPAEVDHRADIYALGVVFYQMLTGELPDQRLDPPSRKVQIDVRLDEIVLRALEKEPECRYQQVSEVKTAVETIVISGSATASAPLSGSLPTEATQAVSSRPTSRPWALIVVAALFIASGCATAWEIAHDLPRHSYDFNLGVLALPIGVGLLRRRPWWRMAALASLWFWLVVMLIFAVLALAGRILPNATVKWQGHELTGSLRIWIILLGCTLGAALLVWMCRVLVRPDVKALFQRGPFARPWIEWGTLAAGLVLAMTVSWLLLETGLDRINSTVTASSFGPAVERVVYVDLPGRAFLNLSTGNYVIPPRDVDPADWTSEKLSGWLAAGSGADVMATQDRGDTRLGICYTSSRQVPNRAWGKPWLLDELPAQLLTNAPSATDSVGVLGCKKGLATFAFHTQHHAAGLLQVLGFTEYPQGVKIRYKLVRNANNVAAPNDSAPELTTPTNQPPASPRTVDEVLTRYTQARGGLAAAQGTTTLMIEGTWESIPGLGTLEAEALIKPPDKWLVALKDEHGLVFQRALDGAAGWDVSKSFGTTQVDAGTLQVWGILLGLYRGEPMATLLPNMSLKGKETIGSRDACALEAALPQGPPAKLWFDTQTGLLVRIQYAFNGSQFQLDLDDYHDIGGLKLPFKLRQTGLENWTLRCREVKRNEPIEDSRFKRPASH